MRRIHLAIIVATTVLAIAACSTLGAVAGLLGNQVSFTAPQLQGYLDKRFPRDYDKLGGLVTLSVLHPRLSIPQGGTGRDLINRWLIDYARDEPVYRFDDTLLQRLGSRRIGSTTIDNGLVTVHLDQ